MLKKNSLILLIIISILLIAGLGFIFKDKIFKVNTGVIVKDDGVVKMKNLVKINAGSFDVSSITINEGEILTFMNEDDAPHKIVGPDWQSAYFGKTGTFAKGDFVKGEQEVYIEEIPNSKMKIIVK